MGPASDEISAISIGPPDPPTQFVAEPGNGLVTLEWVAPVNTGGLPIIKYKYRKWSKNGGADSDGILTDIPDSGPGGDNDTSYTVGNLENGSLYAFHHTQFSLGRGKVPLAAASSPTPDVKPIGPPSAPRNPQFTVGDGQLTLSWQTPSSDGGSAITRHEYITKVGSNGTWPSTWTAIPNSAHDGANATSFVVTPLNNGTEYTFQIRAVNDVDAGASVTTASATPEPATTVPEAPTDLKAIPSDTKFFLSWEPPANNGGEIITKYQYQHKLSSANTWSAWSDVSLSGVGEANEKSTTVSGFTNGTNYNIKLRAVNTRGNGIGVELASSIAPNRPSSFRQKIAGGSQHSCALEDDDQAGGSGVLCWGSNDSEQLGLGDDLANEIINAALPVVGEGESSRGTALAAITEVVAGDFHSCALKHDNTVLCWGNAEPDSSTPVPIVDSDGTGTLSNIQQIDAGTYFSCALKTEGTVWCWGRGTYAQLGNGALSDSSSPVQVVGENNTGFLTNVAQISLGGDRACALTNDGEVLCWGKGP